MDNLHLFEIPYLILVQKLGMGWFFVMRTLSYLGAEVFYALIPVLFYVVGRRQGIAFVSLLLMANFLSGTCKLALHWPRPYWVDDRILNLAPVDSSYGMPSGHALLSFALWGWLGLKAKWKGSFILSMLWAALIAISRVYLGSHWISDVVVGAGLGCALLWLFNRFWTRFEHQLLNASDRLVLVLTLISSAAVLVSQFVIRNQVLKTLDPEHWPVRSELARLPDARTAGLILSIGIGLIIIRRMPYEVSPSSSISGKQFIFARWVSAMLGAAGLGLFLVLFKIWNLRYAPAWLLEGEFVRSCLAGLWLTVLVHWVYTKLRSGITNPSELQRSPST